jgi:tRNA A37 threonylcarbamoyladenosine biosynthesis protein TsaE
MEGKIVKINHFDLYRIKSPSELDEIGLESYFTGDSITIAEWGEIAGERFPETVNVKMSYGEHESERIISIERKKNPPH